MGSATINWFSSGLPSHCQRRPEDTETSYLFRRDLRMSCYNPISFEFELHKYRSLTVSRCVKGQKTRSGSDTLPGCYLYQWKAAPHKLASSSRRSAQSPNLGFTRNAPNIRESDWWKTAFRTWCTRIQSDNATSLYKRLRDYFKNWTSLRITISPQTTPSIVPSDM